MAEARYPIRLYTYHDLDLVTFTQTHDFDIRRAIYCALKAYAKGESFLIKIPPAVRSVTKFQRYYTKILILDTEKDEEMIELLNMVEPARRNNFIKNLLRLYLVYPFSEYFFRDKNAQGLFEEKLEPLRRGKREVQAGKTKSKSRPASGRKESGELSSPVSLPTKETEEREFSSPSEYPVHEPNPAMGEPQYESNPEREQQDVISEEEQDAILDLFNQL